MSNIRHARSRYRRR